jgi:hypothetical protein
MLTSKTYKNNRTKTLALLDELKGSQEGATSLYLPANMSLLETQSFLKQIPTVADMFVGIETLTTASETGIVLFWGQSKKLLLVPPFPLKEKYLTHGYDVVPLQSLLTPDHLIGIVLVRLGSYSIGLCRGETLIDHKTGTGLVHGRHRQGGSSSHRFEHRRKEQAYHFLERVGLHVKEKLEPYSKTLDYLVYGGARTTIMQLRKQIDFLQKFDDHLLPPRLDITEPKLDVLEKTVTDIWTSRVTEWREL